MSRRLAIAAVLTQGTIQGTSEVGDVQIAEFYKQLVGAGTSVEPWAGLQRPGEALQDRYSLLSGTLLCIFMSVDNSGCCVAQQNSPIVYRLANADAAGPSGRIEERATALQSLQQAFATQPEVRKAKPREEPKGIGYAVSLPGSGCAILLRHYLCTFTRNLLPWCWIMFSDRQHLSRLAACVAKKTCAHAQLLAKAGWTGGGLGAQEQGITTPLPAWHQKGRRGIGAASGQPPKPVSSAVAAVPGQAQPGGPPSIHTDRPSS